MRTIDLGTLLLYDCDIAGRSTFKNTIYFGKPMCEDGVTKRVEFLIKQDADNFEFFNIINYIKSFSSSRKIIYPYMDSDLNKYLEEYSITMKIVHQDMVTDIQLEERDGLFTQLPIEANVKLTKLTNITKE